MTLRSVRVSSDFSPVEATDILPPVDDVDQVAAVVQTAAVVDGLDEIPAHGVDGVPGDVRGHHDVVELQQWIAGTDGFVGEHVEAGRGEPAVAQSVDQGG